MATIELELDGDQLTPGQRRLLTSTTRYVLLSGGYGAGKTQALALKVIQLLSANPNAPGLIVAPNWRTLWSVTYRRIRTTLKGLLSPRLVDRTGECYLDFGGESRVYLRSAHNVDGYDGLDVAWAVGDEARYWSRQAWSVLQGRVRVRCSLPQIALVSTPSMGWLADEFDSGKQGRELIVAPTAENERNLAPGFIGQLKSSYSPRMWRALIDGIFTILEGAVFESFDPSRGSPWLCDFAEQPGSRYYAGRPVYLAVDPGYRRSAWLWIVQRDDMDWLVFDQLQAANRTDAQCVAEVNARGWPIDEVWCDPASGSVQSYEGASTLRMLGQIRTRKGRSAVRTIVGANREIPYGVDRLRTILGDPESGQPIRIRFARRLLERERGEERGIIKDLGKLRYPELKDGVPVHDKPLKDGVTDHSTDALRYWAVGRWACDPKLRRLDPLALGPGSGSGWRVASE